MNPRRQDCTDHCSECGGHFHGLGAYDVHHHRVNERINRWGAPEYDVECLDGATAGLEVWTSEGGCTIGVSHTSQITIWRKPESAFVAKMRLLAKHQAVEGFDGDVKGMSLTNKFSTVTAPPVRRGHAA